MALTSRAHAESVGSPSTTFALSSSAGDSTDSTGSTSDSTKPAPKARKLVVPTEGACKKKCSDPEVVYLLLKRTETPRS